jgi:ribosomal-protein-alanine N-acetyltransferase
LQQPTLTTSRLCLRPFRPTDAHEVQKLAGDTRIADTTTTIPHPYPDGAAEAWISRHQPSFEARESVVYAMTLLSDGKLVGTVSLINVSLADARAELGYWVAAEYWRRGFCSEAAEALIQFAAESWGITRIVARCLARNPASAGVMEKVGMSYEGRLPLDTRKSGRFEDLLLYGLNLHGRSVA